MGKVGEWFKGLGQNVAQSSGMYAIDTISNTEFMQQQSESGIGKLLGKYKGWIIAFFILVLLALLTPVINAFSNKKSNKKR